MASKHFLPLLILVTLFLSSLSTNTSRDDICSSTVHPKFCQSKLPQNTSTWDDFDYSHFCFRQSFLETRNLLVSLEKHLKTKSSLPTFNVRALEDCQQLTVLNMEFLSRVIKTLGNKLSPPDSFAAQDMEALLSAVLTNQQTCLDGLQGTTSAWNAATDLHTPLSDGNKINSISLALFTRVWRHEQRHGASKREERKLASSKNNKRRTLPAFLKSILVNETVVVNPDGSGNFTTITDAVNAAPNNTDISNGYFVIYIVAGVYEEYVNVASNKVNLLMIGDGINRTVITGNRSVADGWTTFNSATFIVVAQGFVGVDMTIRNTAGAIKYQAVALRNGADMSTFYRCSFEGRQDTLYPHSLRQFYRECDIYGTVDFILGNAAVVFQNCNIYPTKPIPGQSNEITAQSRTDPNQNTGFSIHNCTIRVSAELASSINDTTKTYLGRPWREYSRTVYMQSFMDSLIAPPGWDIWSGDFALATLYYAEYNNTGPGSDTTNRVTWPGYHKAIDAVDASNFTVSNFIVGDAWLPRTGVPYTGGLI